LSEASGPLGRDLLRRFVSLTIWSYAVWVLLTWTRTAEQLLTGLAIALLVAALLTPLGSVAAPWALLDPRRLAALVALAASASWRIVVANARLSRRIWAPSRPVRPGMVIVPTLTRTDGELAAVGLVTSLIVDNQIVDLDRERHELQYHAVDVPPPEPQQARVEINEPVERLLPAITRRTR
jgi:multicomponent Na+:H+ antiporter subunit E